MESARFGPARPPWALGAIGVAALGGFLGLVGPFGSYNAGPALERVVHWTGTLAIGTLVYGTAVRSILRLNLSPAATLVSLATVVVILTAPFSWLVSVAAHSLWPRIEAMSPLDWYAQVLLISVPLVLGPALVVRCISSKGSGFAHVRPAEGLLGVPFRDVVCLQMEDHYVRVHTAEGSRLVLATMGEAIAALGDTPGLRVHRSWWVADTAVVGVAKLGRNLRLRLTNGALAPVARSSVHAVRAGGWMPTGEQGDGQVGRETLRANRARLGR